MLSRRWAAAALAATLLLGACGGDAGPQRSVLLVSGKDDHGLQAAGRVPLLSAPDGEPAGSVADGTLVEVVGTSGEWLQVRVVADAPVEIEGWLNDFHLRGQVHLVVPDAPACPVALVGEPGGPAYAQLRPSEQVVLVDHHRMADGMLWVGVVPLQDEAIGLVPSAWISELPGPTSLDGQDCAEVALDTSVRPHRH